MTKQDQSKELCLAIKWKIWIQPLEVMQNSKDQAPSEVKVKLLS